MNINDSVDECECTTLVSRFAVTWADYMCQRDKILGGQYVLTNVCNFLRSLSVSHSNKIVTNRKRSSAFYPHFC
jgi:hypothetical protein